jgi:Zn-dependent protease
MKWKLTRLSGIDVYVHWSFWLLPALILYSAIGAGAGLLTALNSVVLVFAVFGCVVLHELGHAMAARFYGVGTHDITLYPIGGVASLERIPTRPGQELVIALAGPAVNVAIASGLLVILGIGPLLTAGLVNPLGGGFLTQLLWINISLVLFNMLPAFPMDGGRVLRASLALVLPYTSATAIAGRIGQGMAVLLGVLGLVSTTWQMVLIAVFVYLAASAELARISQFQSFIPAKPLRPVPGSSNSDDDIIWV